MIDRRHLLLTATAGAGLALAGPVAARSGADDRLDAMLSRWFDEDVDQSPETATNLGLDRGAKAHLSSKLADRSEAAWMADRATANARLQSLADFDQTGLTRPGTINLAVAAFRAQTASTGASFDYGSAIEGGRMGPYLVNQMTGSYFTVPDFMDTQHRVEDRDGAEAFLARLSALGPNLDAETGRVARDAGKGVTPPDFIIDLTLGQLKALRGQPATDMAMIRTLERKATALGLSGYGDRAAAIVETGGEAGPRPADRRLRAAASGRRPRRRRLAAARRRAVLRPRPEILDYDHHDARRGPRRGPRTGGRHQRRDRYDPEGPGHDPGHGR